MNGFFLASFFANYVATVKRFSMRRYSTLAPAETHILMYILPGFCHPCGRNFAALFSGNIEEEEELYIKYFTFQEVALAGTLNNC